MRVTLALVGLGMVVVAPHVSAQGCGPTRLKVSESVVLDLPPARAWSIVGDFQEMRWDVAVAAVAGTGGNEADHAVRTVTLRDGATLAESLYRYDPEAMTYAYHFDRVDVARLPVQNASATLEVSPDDGGTKSIVRWKAAFYRNLAPGEGAPDAADARAVAAMRHLFRSGLDGLKAKVDPRT